MNDYHLRMPTYAEGMAPCDARWQMPYTLVASIRDVWDNTYFVTL